MTFLLRTATHSSGAEIPGDGVQTARGSVKSIYDAIRLPLPRLSARPGPI